MDFGKKYMNRIFIYSSVFFGMYLFYTIMFILSYFGIISFEFSLMINAIAIYDVAIVLTIIMMMLYYGAVINS